MSKVRRRCSVQAVCTSLRGTIGSIADELAAEIFCDWALVNASKALEQSRFEFAHDQERGASDEAIIDVTADDDDCFYYFKK